MTRPTRLDAHPSVVAARAAPAPDRPEVLDAGWLRALCLDAGADDAGFVEITRPALADQVTDITTAFPPPAALVSLVCRTNREAVRSPARSVGNLEVHQTYDRTNEIARDIVTALQDRGVRALNPSVGFPMEMQHWPGKIWVVSHKPVAVEAGLGRIGIHRNVIHPRFGNFILLATLVIDTPVSAYGRPLDYNPCLECKLCVAACPTGAISKTGEFDFSACASHNYREFLTGFGDWVENIASSSSPREYREKVTDPETVSMWQSLAFSPQYKAAYCVSVCPAGEDVLGPYLADRRAHLDDVVKPLQDKVETVYVIKGSDAEAYVPRRFPHKRVQRAGLGIRPSTIESFVFGMPLLFQRGAAARLDARYHLVFRGSESREVTVEIRRVGPGPPAGGTEPGGDRHRPGSGPGIDGPSGTSRRTRAGSLPPMDTEFAQLPLRARKRARTRASIERTALGLFVERGFDATTVADIADACEIGERTFFSYFASKEDVALSDISADLDALQALVAARRPGQGLIELFRVSGRRRLEMFRSNELQAEQRRAVEADNPRVHARAIALREQREHLLLAPEFARELDTTPSDPRVLLLTAAFSGMSSVVNRIIAEAADDEAVERVLQQALDVLEAALRTLRQPV